MNHMLITLAYLLTININCICQSKQEVYDQINKARINQDVDPLPIDRKLEKSAQSWAFFMPYRGVHNTNFRRRFKRGGAECIAWGDSPVDGWMKSKQHKAIIMGQSVKAMGAGYWRGKWVLRTFTK